jgi:hypothetical protein
MEKSWGGKVGRENEVHPSGFFGGRQIIKRSYKSSGGKESEKFHEKREGAGQPVN